MTHTHLTLAIALAVSLGIVRPDATPTREVPLSKSDIVIATNDSDAAGSAKMSSGSASQPSQAGNDETKSDKMKGSDSK